MNVFQFQSLYFSKIKYAKAIVKKMKFADPSLPILYFFSKSEMKHLKHFERPVGGYFYADK